MADSNGAFPELTIDVGQSAQYNTSQPISTLEQAVEGTLREVLAWRPRTTDPKGFLAALNQAFTEQEVDGHSTWAWTPRSYSVQADMGAVTGAQASIYARARAALDQSVPLIEGLRPLRADADDEDVEAIRALVQSQLTELIDELGVVGGPRQDRIKGLFNTLLGNKTPADPDDVHGLLGLMRDRFGLERQRVNTVEEEQNLTNFRIIVDHVIGLKRSWKTLKHYFDRDGTDVFLGTQLVLLSRSLDVIAESVRELYFKLDSVWLGAAERQTVTLKSGLTIAELLSWVERFAGEEAPRIIREAGKDGVVALQPTLEKLQNLVQSAWDESKGAGNNPQAGFHRERIQIGLEEMTLHLREAAKLASQIRREPAPMITAVFPDHAYVNDKVWLTVNGRYFQDGAKVQLRKVSVTDPSKNLEIKAAHVTVVSDTQICANFDLTGAKSGTWQVVITNPDGSENEPKNNTFTIEEPPNDDDKPAPEPFQVEMIEVITVTGAKLDNDVVDSSAGVTGITITFNNEPSIGSFVALNENHVDFAELNVLISYQPLGDQLPERIPVLILIPCSVTVDAPLPKQVIVDFLIDETYLSLKEEGTLSAGLLTVTLFGDENGKRLAITDKDGVRLDGDEDGDEGGTYTFTFMIEDTGAEEAA